MGLVSVDMMDPQVGSSFSLFSIFVPVLPLDRNISGLKIFRQVGVPNHQAELREPEGVRALTKGLEEQIGIATPLEEQHRLA